MTSTLDSGISVASGKNNKHCPLKKHIPLHQLTQFRTVLWITHFNKDVAPGKNPKINKGIPMFIPESRVLSYMGLSSISKWENL